jgi:hypothetical protein
LLDGLADEITDRVAHWVAGTDGSVPSGPAHQRYCAAEMNSPKVSHHTSTVLYCAMSTPSGTSAMKPSKVLMSPMRGEAAFSGRKPASSSTNSLTS